MEKAVANARDAFDAVPELYEDLGKEVPSEAIVDEARSAPFDSTFSRSPREVS